MDDLQRELGTLEAQLARTTPESPIIDELAAMRGNLAGPRTEPRFELANLRIASPCKERWADMTGDERVRVCNGCERPVFNLSEMTRAQAEAVLATRGIKPCVRFYRRSDGTVMTSDCGPGARRSHRLTVITAGTLLGASSPALADEPVPVDEVPTYETPVEDVPKPATPGNDPCDVDLPTGKEEWTMGVIIEERPARRPAIEWSTWGRLGYGIASRPADFVARATTPPMPESAPLGEGALGVDASVAIARRGAIRIGAWAEWRTVSDPVLGGELIVGGLPVRHHAGSMGIVLRGGGNDRVATGALGIGYTVPDPWLGAHHATSLRAVTSVTRSTDDPRDWSITLGLEVDLLGALGYVARLAR